MTRRFQFSLGRLLGAMPLVAFGLACLVRTHGTTYEQLFTLMMLVDVSFGAALGLVLHRTGRFAVYGSLLATAFLIGAWAVKG